jgi:hypothetical protein
MKVLAFIICLTLLGVLTSAAIMLFSDREQERDEPSDKDDTL